MIDIALLATGAWKLIEPHLPALATKASDVIAKKVPEAVQKLWAAITKKFEAKPAAKEALEDVQKSPEDPDTQATFRQQLKKTMIEDESFATELSKLLEAAGSTYTATLNGEGAIAQGSGARAVGERGVMIEGGVHGGNVSTGDDDSSEDEKNEK